MTKKQEIQKKRKKKEKPYYLVNVRSEKVASVEVDVDDHLGRSVVSTYCWQNGEGFTLRINQDDAQNQIDLTWSQWDALKVCARDMLKNDS